MNYRKAQRERRRRRKKKYQNSCSHSRWRDLPDCGQLWTSRTEARQQPKNSSCSFFFLFRSKWLLFCPSFLFVRLIFMSFYSLVSVKRQLNGNLFHFGRFAGPDRSSTDRSIVNTHNIFSVTNAQFKLYPICSDSGVEHEHFIGRPNEI